MYVKLPKKDECLRKRSFRKKGKRLKQSVKSLKRFAILKARGWHHRLKETEGSVSSFRREKKKLEVHNTREAAPSSRGLNEGPLESLNRASPSGRHKLYFLGGGVFSRVRGKN